MRTSKAGQESRAENQEGGRQELRETGKGEEEEEEFKSIAGDS